MSACSKVNPTSTPFVCLKKGIWIGRSMGAIKVTKKPDKREQRAKQAAEELKRVTKELKKKTVKLSKPKKSQTDLLGEMEKSLEGAYKKMEEKKRGVKAGSKRGGYKKSEAVLLKEKKAAAKALKKALEKAEKTGKKETRGVKKGVKRGKYKK